MPDPKNGPTPHQDSEDPKFATEAPEMMPPRPEPTGPETQRPDGVLNLIAGENTPELAIPIETVAWIILKAREFDMKDPATEARDQDDGNNPLGVLEDRQDDATVTELGNWIVDLNDDALAELVAIMWLGRSEVEDITTFPALVEQAQGEQGHGRNTVSYLLGTPLLGDYLEEGLEKLGVDTTDLEGGLF